MRDMYEFLGTALPDDHARQMHSHTVLGSLVERGFKPGKVLDLGCGDGRSIDLFRRVLPEAEWTGVDIESSAEVDQRRRTDGKFITYNGIDIPFPEKHFDLVFNHQVLEHVRFPEPVLKETFRVLKPGGLFVCETSQFEPYHSRSYWNFTIYGIVTLLRTAGFRVTEIRPGIDAWTLIDRAFLGRQRDKEINKFFGQESPMNTKIDEMKLSVKETNLRKLLYCGQFIVVGERP